MRVVRLLADLPPSGTARPRAFSQKVTEILRSLPAGYGGNKRLAQGTTKHPGTIGRYRRSGCPETWYGLIELAMLHPLVLECILREVGREDLADQVGGRTLPNINAIMGMLQRLLERSAIISVKDDTSAQCERCSTREHSLDLLVASNCDNDEEEEEEAMDMKSRIKVIADLYRQARDVGDQRLMGVAEAAMMEAMVAESAIARVAVGESLIAEALRAK